MRPSQRVYWAACPSLSSDTQRMARSAPDTKALPAPEDGLGQRHDPEGGRPRVEQPPRKKQRGAHEDRAAIADTIGEIAGGKLAEDHGEAEDGLEDHDVGERHADLVLPEERDDGNGKEKELARRVGHEEPDIFHEAAAFMEPRREHEAERA